MILFLRETSEKYLQYQSQKYRNRIIIEISKIYFNDQINFLSYC